MQQGRDIGFEAEALGQFRFGKRRGRGKQQSFEQPLLITPAVHAPCPPPCPVAGLRK